MMPKKKERKKLYRVSIPGSIMIGLDTFDSFVACARGEEIARNMDPHTGKPMDWASHPDYWWPSYPSDVEVEFLGYAAPTVKEGVVCASFNAG